MTATKGRCRRPPKCLPCTSSIVPRPRSVIRRVCRATYGARYSTPNTREGAVV
jgi:hypothetical protein